MDSVFTVMCFSMAIIFMFRGLAARAKAKKEDELLERNPEAWKKLKELELEKTARNRQAGLARAITIAKFFFKR